ncbi:hypothetical protein SAMN07250955_11823 [Arboricoccus pini]|uniref:Uncharacterized protein n=1 Tax=Arboricoccus pini TaxID=1963835 RepID=A0A212RZC7_9PROT|nr:hypothetical protein SAMN07250955_11823 [Arboricoccus pini]
MSVRETRRHRDPLSSILEFVALGALAQQLAIATNGFRLLAGATLGRLFIVPAHAHLAIKPLALHLLLECAQSLIDIIVANLNLDDGTALRWSRAIDFHH